MAGKDKPHDGRAAGHLQGKPGKGDQADLIANVRDGLRQAKQTEIPVLERRAHGSFRSLPVIPVEDQS
jgi:hypothetical protein